MVFALITLVFGAIFGVINGIAKFFQKIFHFIFQKGGLFVKIMQSDSNNMNKIKKFSKNRLRTLRMNDEI